MRKSWQSASALLLCLSLKGCLKSSTCLDVVPVTHSRLWQGFLLWLALGEVPALVLPYVVLVCGLAPVDANRPVLSASFAFVWLLAGALVLLGLSGLFPLFWAAPSV